MHVSPSGSDQAGDGSSARPFRTLHRALTDPAGKDVELGPGRYAEGDVTILRPVDIAGAGPGVTWADAILVRSGDVHLRGIEVQGGISVEHARGVRLSSLTVRPGQRADAVEVLDGEVGLDALNASCGAETCLEVEAATVALSGGRFAGLPESKRAIRALTSSLTISRLEVTGTSIDQALVDGGRVTIRTSTFSGSKGAAVAVVNGGALEAEGLFGLDASTTALLVSGGSARVTGCRLSAPTGIDLGVAASWVSLGECTLEPAAGAGISVSSTDLGTSTVTLSDVVVEHRQNAGLLLSGGHVTVLRAHFIGQASPAANAPDAIIAHGAQARLDVEQTLFDDSPAFAVSLNEGASGTISATIARPALGGILVDTYGAEPTLRALRIEDCTTGSGVVVQGSSLSRLEGVVIARCAEAGILANGTARVRVRGARLIGNAQFGVAALERATVDLGATEIAGSPSATFAECATGARVLDSGGNGISGHTVTCP